MRIKQYDSLHYRIVELTEEGGKVFKPDDILGLLEQFHSSEMRLAGVHMPGSYFAALVYEKCPTP